MTGSLAEFTREGEPHSKTEQNPVSVLVARSDYPFEWYDEKEKHARGLRDYMRHLSKVSGLNFEFYSSGSG